MAAGESPSKRIIIPKGTLEPNQNNVIEIPEGCEDSRVLIARLQQRFQRPPGYYPPLTNPDNKFERRIGETVVGLGMPPLSPLKEERHNYQCSLSKYGSPKYISYEPSYFGHDTTHGENSISGKFDYCPSSTPKATRAQMPIEFSSPNLSPIRMGRDIFAPDASVYRSTFTPKRPPPPPRPPSPTLQRPPVQRPSGRGPPPRPARPPVDDDCSCSLGDLSGMMSYSGGSRRAPSPPRPSPTRPLPTRPSRPPVDDDCSCSLGDLSAMMSYSGGSRRAPSPPRPSPPRPLPTRPSRPPVDDDCSCSLGDLSAMMSYSGGSRRAPSPPRPSPPRPLPTRPSRPPVDDDYSCSLGDLSDMMSYSGGSGRGPSPTRPPTRPSPTRPPPPRATARSPPRRAQPPARARSPISDRSCSIGDLSDMISFEVSRGARSSLNYTPDSIRGMSQINPLAVPGTPIPEELHNTTMNDSMAELDNMDLQEMRTIEDRMRSFQEARRELVLSILALPEAEVQ